MSLDLLPRLLREKDVAVVHTHALGRIGGIGRLAARMRNAPLVVTIHGGVLDLPAEMKKDFNKPVGGLEWGKIFGLLLQSRRLLVDADAIITCNENEASLLREQYPGKRVVVQPHGVPLDIYQEDRREQALEAFPQIRGKQVLLTVGRIDPVKNQSWVVEQAPQIFRKFPNAIIVFAGAVTDEAYGEKLRQRIQALGLEDRVLLTGGLPPNDPRLIGLFQEAERARVALQIRNVRPRGARSLGHGNDGPVHAHVRRLHAGAPWPERLAVRSGQSRELSPAARPGVVKFRYRPARAAARRRGSAHAIQHHRARRAHEGAV